MNRFALLIILSVILIASSQKYRKIVHTTDPEAKCLDGTPPAIYVHEGSEKEKFLIFLEGGGFCQGESQSQTIEQCYQRSKTMLGSSNLWPNQIEGQGYLSTNPTQSNFANWTKFIFAYCDGSLHQGHRNQPIKYKNTSLYFRGDKIVRAQLMYIQNNYKISKAKKVVWTGGSAGAVGAYLWSGFLRQFKTQQMNTYIIIDSGIFLDAPGHGTQNHHLATQLKSLYKISNADKSTPLEVCNVFFPGNQWKCFLIQYNYQFLLGNFLFINSQYDSWAISNILKIKCLQNSSTGSGASLSKCNKAEMDSIQKYRQLFQLVVFDFLQISNKNSCWSIACSNHVYACLASSYESNYHRIPEITGSTVRQTVEDFVINEKQRITTMDLQPWPSNHPCAI